MLEKLFDPARQRPELINLSISGDVTISMIWCPAGELLMGSSESDKFAHSDEHPQRRIHLTKGFWIGRTQVTCEQWDVCMDESIFYPSEKGLPIAGISWSNAQLFCEKLTAVLLQQGTLNVGETFSLPSEAQWEYACRAGTTTTRYFGEDDLLLKDHAWYRENSKHVLRQVGQKLPNPWGIFDLYGNVYEWCLDNSYGYIQHIDNVINPIIQYDDTHTSLKAVRGGSCNSMSNYCRSAARYFSDAFNGMGDPIGLRVALINNQ